MHPSPSKFVIAAALVLLTGCSRDVTQSAPDTSTGDTADVPPPSDGASDADEWIADACQITSPRPINLYTNHAGNWTVALAPTFDNYTTLNLSNVAPEDAAAFYDDDTTEVAGALASRAPRPSTDNPVDSLRNAIPAALSTVGTVRQDTVGGRFDTHDRHGAATARFVLETDSEMTPRALRQQLLFELAPFSNSRAANLPPTDGTKHTTYRVSATVILRRDADDAPSRLLTALALSPQSAYDNDEQVRFQMDDLTNTTNIAAAGRTPTDKCDTFRAVDNRLDVEVYFVVDAELGSHADAVRKFAGRFADEISNTSVDYRFGATNMQPANQGRLHSPELWTDNKSDLLTALDDVALDCKSTDAWQCGGQKPHGLQVARSGIEFMTGNATATPPDDQRIRPDAQILTFFFTDDPAASVNAGTSVGSYETFFDKTAVVGAFTPGDDCAGPSAGQSYRDVAVGSGGNHASLCADDLTQVVRDYIFQTSGLPSSQPVLNTTPISSSVVAWLDGGQRVPRSRQNGFDYFAAHNSLAFFGMFRNENYAPLPYFQVVRYETFAP